MVGAAASTPIAIGAAVDQREEILVRSLQRAYIESRFMVLSAMVPMLSAA